MLFIAACFYQIFVLPYCVLRFAIKDTQYMKIVYFSYIKHVVGATFETICLSELVYFHFQGRYIQVLQYHLDNGSVVCV